MKRILGLWTDWGDNQYRKETNEYGGLGYYRIAKPLIALETAFPDDYRVDIYGSNFVTEFTGNLEAIFTKIFTKYDVVYLKQADNAVIVSAMLAAREYFDKRVIFDMDDNHLAVRSDTAAGEVYGFGQKRRYFVSAELSLADGLVVSTEPLRQAYGALPGMCPIQVMPNCNDLADWKSLPKKWNDGKIRIGYMGSVTHNQDFDLVIPPLKQILQKYPHVELELLGLMKPDAFNKIRKKFRSVKGKLTMHFGTPSWKGYPELVASMGWDIGICPLTSDKFNECKSHIKWMEYSMAKIAVVASKVYPYYQPINGTETIVHGETGLLASTTDEWVSHLSDLIENPAKRQLLAHNAFQHIANKWQWNQHIGNLKSFIDNVCNSPIRPQKTE